MSKRIAFEWKTTNNWKKNNAFFFIVAVKAVVIIKPDCPWDAGFDWVDPLSWSLIHQQTEGRQLSGFSDLFVEYDEEECFMSMNMTHKALLESITQVIPRPFFVCARRLKLSPSEDVWLLSSCETEYHGAIWSVIGIALKMKDTFGSFLPIVFSFSWLFYYFFKLGQLRFAWSSWNRSRFGQVVGTKPDSGIMLWNCAREFRSGIVRRNRAQGLYSFDDYSCRFECYCRQEVEQNYRPVESIAIREHPTGCLEEKDTRWPMIDKWATEPRLRSRG